MPDDALNILLIKNLTGTGVEAGGAVVGGGVAHIMFSTRRLKRSQHYAIRGMVIGASDATCASVKMRGNIM